VARALSIIHCYMSEPDKPANLQT